MDPFVEAAREAGVGEIGFTERIYYPKQTRTLSSHPDLVKFFGVRVASFDYGPVADAIADSGVAVEVSTAGLRQPVRELYPHPEFLAACRERDVPVTLASDAHSPEVVGRDFDLALELLRGAGYETVTVFEQRRERQVPLG